MSEIYSGAKAKPDTYYRLYDRAEDAARSGLPVEEALQAVRDGYSSHAADVISEATLKIAPRPGETPWMRDDPLVRGKPPRCRQRGKSER